MSEPFTDHRALLFSVAYSILGSAADAEDVVQDTWLRWSRADRSAVGAPKAYLVRIAANLATDRLRSAQVRRESYVGPWLPEPIVTDPDPDAGDQVATADAVSSAMLVVLETLGPVERAVFVLREVFDVPHGEIAEALGRSEAAVRQTARRAREHVLARRPRFGVSRERREEVTRGFLAAATGGDVNALLDLLAPEVALWTDGGGKVRHLRGPIVGADRVARWFAGVATRPYEGVDPAAMTVEVVELNGGPGVVFSGAGRTIGTLTLDLDEDGLVVAIHNVANPDKLAAVTARTVHPVRPAQGTTSKSS